MKSDSADDHAYIRIAEDVLGEDLAGWEAHDGPHWYQLSPVNAPRRLQGWKIHLAAEPRTAAEVLRRAAAVLVAEGCPFKFVRERDALRRSLGRGFDRAASGKFITAYPADDDRFQVLARALHEATAGLPGPRILSDRAYAPGSLVHYRYGGFTPVTQLGEDGSWRDMLVSPHGLLEQDRRVPWFQVPAWERDPMTDTGQPGATVGRTAPAAAAPTPATVQKAAPAAAAPAPVLLHSRYRVTGAIRQTNRGGIYRAVDTLAGDARVIIKQARPHTDVQPDGTDARDLLLNEADILTSLKGTGICAEFVEAFTVRDEQFVVQAELPGQDLEDWLLEHVRQGTELPLEELLACVHALLDLTDRVHAAGVVVQDFSAANVLRRPDGTLSLIDMEAAAHLGGPGSNLMTPGFVAPERRAARHSGGTLPADIAGDLYSLGAIICFLGLGQHPFLLPDQGPDARPDSQRLGAWLDAAAAAGRPLARRVRAMVVGLMDQEPEHRWDVGRARASVTAGTTAPFPAGQPGGGLPGPGQLLTGSLRSLITSLRPHGDELWRKDERTGDLMPGTVMHGASGITSVLLRAWSHRDALEPADLGLLEQALETADRWHDTTLTAKGTPLPGLYGGHAGMAWAAHDVASAVGDRFNQQRSLALAARLPVDSAIPDVYHGTAGAGLALLHLWRTTGDERLRTRARACADTLVRRAVAQDQLPGWPLTSAQAYAHGDTLSGRIHQGYVHGSAGIGAFLLRAGTEWDDQVCLDIAVAVGDALAGSAVLSETAAGTAALWDIDPEEPGDRLPDWCQGAAGIGSFLLQLWQATGEPVFRVRAEQAGAAVSQALARQGAGVCHGLAGAGHFLLDLAQALPESVHDKEARSVPGWLAVRAITSPEGFVPAGDGPDGGPETQSFGFGTAGDLDFLLRLTHGGPGPWQP